MMGPHFWITFLWYICITYWNNIAVGLSLWRTSMTSQLHYLFVETVRFFDDVRITLNYGDCWNVWIVYRSYVKWSYFNCIAYLAHQLFDNADIFDNVKITFTLNMEIMLQHVSYLFSIVTNSSKRHNCNIICFDAITNFKRH